MTPSLRMRVVEAVHVGFLGFSENEYGTKVSVFVCESCGALFTVTGGVSEESWGRGCLAETCDSYDVSRDVDLMFGIEPWRVEQSPKEETKK